ncbi:MAG: hypothetical protein L7F78_13770, partial [Syntrophales bacterium LBB04]|nr:hypothetical protein [Syntrophales bacterium LBB04]
MKRLISFFAVVLLMALSFGIEASLTLAQPYPNRSVQFVIPATPGSVIDITGRIVADELSKNFGKPFVPINKPGGSFTLGTDFVARSKKDGYTLVYTNNPAIVYSRILSPDTVRYDPDKDLEPLGLHLFF